MLEESRDLLLLLEKRVTSIKDSGGEGVERAWMGFGNETNGQGVDPAPRDIEIFTNSLQCSLHLVNASRSQR